MPSDVLTFAHNMKGALREAAPRIEQNRGLEKDLAVRLARGGLFRLFTPAWLGGLEMKPHQAFEAIEAVAMGDMSAAWCCMIGSTSALGGAWLTREAATEIFTQPDIMFAGVAAPQGEAVRQGDEYHVSGRWQWGSGSNNADYFIGGCMIKEEQEKTTQRILIFRADQIALHDTWHVMGLNGSASNDVAVASAKVKVAHSFSIASDQPHSDSPLYRIPFFGILAAGIAACALGNAAAVLEAVKDLANEKTPHGTRSRLADKAYVQLGMAQRAAELSAARAYFYQTLCEVWDSAAKNDQPSVEDRAKMRLAAIYAAQTSSEVIARLHRLAGGTSIFLSSPIQRRLRDGHIATQHRMVSETNLQLLGQIVLGTADPRIVRAAQL